MWHITIRELYNNLNSLRFALTTVLLLALMVTNAVRHIREHPKRVQKYHDAVTESMNQLTSRADASLYKLAHEGPGTLYKKPSPLHFCAAGGETLLPDRVDSPSGSRGFWRLEYPDANINMKNVGPGRFPSGLGIHHRLYLVVSSHSYLRLMLSPANASTAHSRLMLANAIPRHTVLIGKFLGALISTTIPFMLAMLVNLLMISSASEVHLNTEAWGRLGIILFIALLYTCLFLALGLLVSARVQRSAVSLVILLLTWVTFVAFMPSTLAALASGFFIIYGIS